MLTVKPGINPQNEIPLKLESDVFEIRVKSAATDQQWVQSFTNYTYNRGSEIEDVNPMLGNPPAHGISLFANPILSKPAASGPGMVTVTPGAPTPDPATFDTLIFQPGVHVIGKSYPLHPSKSYYIPGDAILLGTSSNLLSTSGSNRTRGDTIRMFGYGTINSAIFTHYLYPGHVPGPTEF